MQNPPNKQNPPNFLTYDAILMLFAIYNVQSMCYIGNFISGSNISSCFAIKLWVEKDESDISSSTTVFLKHPLAFEK